jgi:hypothetical protein
MDNSNKGKYEPKVPLTTPYIYLKEGMDELYSPFI